MGIQIFLSKQISWSYFSAALNNMGFA
jgi:hypothetical protein